MLTTPCIGSSLLPGVIAELADRHPGVRVDAAEQRRHDVEPAFPADGVVVAVLPALPHPLAPGLRERLLWREPMRVVVPPDHELARLGTARSRVDELVRGSRWSYRAAAAAEPEMLELLARRGLAAGPAGAGGLPRRRCWPWPGPGSAWAWLTRWPLAHARHRPALSCWTSTTPDLVREVAAYWYDVLTGTEGVGMRLLGEVLAGPAPTRGATGRAAGRSREPADRRGVRRRR